jgi:IS30 family transposase
MSEGRKNHMDFHDRSVIDDGIRDGLAAREIARRIKVAASTVIREVKQNRSVKYPTRKGVVRARRCIHYADCQQSATACEKCSSQWTTCKKCRTRSCIDTCPQFELRICPKTQSWPYVCPRECTKRTTCGYPRYSYGASQADVSYRTRLVSSREGIDISDEELIRMFALIEPLVLQGQSFDAIWAEHKDELPVCVRTFYNYQEQGITSVAAINMPQKVRRKPRRKGEKKDGEEKARTRIDRTGRLYEDFEGLSEEDKLRVVQGDSVIGHITNTQRILSLQWKRLSFQLYLLVEDGSSKSVVDRLDLIERTLGSPEAFEILMGVLLVDRGGEFDDWAGMERSCLQEGVARCRVYYCDAGNSNQKSEAERNHEFLRRILPKERSDFDALSKSDVAWVCSQVNSYPRPILNGARPYDLALPVLGQEFLDALSILRIPADEVVLSTKLFPHVVEQ